DAGEARVHRVAGRRVEHHVGDALGLAPRLAAVDELGQLLGRELLAEEAEHRAGELRERVHEVAALEHLAIDHRRGALDLGAIVLSGSLAACGSKGPAPMPPVPADANGSTPEVRSPVVSWDLLEKEPVANEADVHHILISWKDLAAAFGGRIDERAAGRTQ